MELKIARGGTAANGGFAKKASPANPHFASGGGEIRQIFERPGAAKSGKPAFAGFSAQVFSAAGCECNAPLARNR